MGMRIGRRGRRRREADGLRLRACHSHAQNTDIKSPFLLRTQVLPFEPPLTLILPLADLPHTVIHRVLFVISSLQWSEHSGLVFC